ncbi:MAG: hypothetical protein SWQ30_09525 [Thermodesulfobacteriota bacterium]|nr:hypothetical protein [Thermodesulfobacteriota bacterium]
MNKTGESAHRFLISWGGALPPRRIGCPIEAAVPVGNVSSEIDCHLRNITKRFDLDCVVGYHKKIHEPIAGCIALLFRLCSYPF